MTTSITRRRFAALAGLGVVAARGARADDLTPITVDYDGYSITTGPIYYGVGKGIFRKYGLDLTLGYMDGGTTLTQAIVGGSVVIGQNGYTPAIAAAVQGADDVFIGSISAKLPFQLVVRKGITGDQLKGKKIAVSRLGASSDVAATYALAHFGLARSDAVILQLGGEGTRTAALMSGQIDGSMEQLPLVANLEASGRFDTLVDCTIVAGDYPNTGYVSRRSYIKKNPDIIRKFIMGLSDSIHSYKMDKPGACAATAALLKVPNNEAMATTWDSFTKNVFPDIPYPSLKGIQLVLNDLAKQVPKAARIKPEDIVDASAIDELVSQGFYKNLLGS